MLPCRLDAAGLRGASSSADRLVPAMLPFTGAGLLSWLAVSSSLVFLFSSSSWPAVTPWPTSLVGGGVWGGVGTFWTGDSGGGGMSVPSVMLPKLRLRAGSSKREEPPPLLPNRDDMTDDDVGKMNEAHGSSERTNEVNGPTQAVGERASGFSRRLECASRESGDGRCSERGFGQKMVKKAKQVAAIRPRVERGLLSDGSGK